MLGTKSSPVRTRSRASVDGWRRQPASDATPRQKSRRGALQAAMQVSQEDVTRELGDVDGRCPGGLTTCPGALDAVFGIPELENVADVDRGIILRDPGGSSRIRTRKRVPVDGCRRQPGSDLRNASLQVPNKERADVDRRPPGGVATCPGARNSAF
ncbi:hypothetical protein OH76DRAFT_1562230 [Lentinus brumalis]|uniref:Uncharacterized protein n=1 Tax=Lentinus brumalis TaxID=2498619 RepID=A0A371CIK9_9APHY|nr:hypothetical protein OH76DRAFT_1562230 [Polyporus brumalis]